MDRRADRVGSALAGDQLIDLRLDQQRLFLDGMALLATAVATVCARRDPDFRRVNAEIQGSTDAFLHAHVTPRYSWEPADVVGLPAVVHHLRGLVDPVCHRLGPQHHDLRSDLGAAIDRELARRA